MDKIKAAVIYLASGNSKRFGQENKLLQMIGTKPMYRYGLDRLIDICKDHEGFEIIVVTQYQEIRHAKSDVIDTAVRTICVAVVGFFAIWSGFKFAIAPPLLGAFTEFSRPKNKARNKPVKTVLVITVCAFVGAVSRYVLNMTLGLPLTVAALTATAIMLVIVYCTKMYIPPAGALTILSMIIPSESVLLYPLQILVGIAVIMLISRLLFMKQQN